MSVSFSKYQGTGNDFILIDNRHSNALSVSPEEATKICDRHYGIGGDGVIFATPANGNSDFGMRILNRDGSEPEMCGNGIRCLAKFVAEIDGDGQKQFKIDTLAGLIQPVLLDDGQVCVDMGEPILDAPSIPTTLPSNPSTHHVLDQSITVDDRHYSVTAVSMGNPHACIYSINGSPLRLADIDLPKIGPLFAQLSVFPSGVNTEFVEVVDRSFVKMLVWERGAGPTMACGTGACALVVAGVMEGRIDRKCRVELPGGSLEIDWDETDNHVYMTGPAACVFTGNVKLSE